MKPELVAHVFNVVAEALQADGVPVRCHMIDSISWTDRGLLIVAHFITDVDGLGAFEDRLFKQEEWQWLTRVEKWTWVKEYLNVTLELRPKNED